MTRLTSRFLLVCGLLSAAAASHLHAQDARGTVPEPTFPPVCSQVQADLAVSGGEPSSELNTATDTSSIQTALSAALTNCGKGYAVELVANGANNAFVIAPIFVPQGMTLLVDGGVTVFGSRNVADYQIPSSSYTCGSTDSGTGCYPLINLGQSSLSATSTTSISTSGTNYTTGIMGYGVINGRGADKLITLNSQTNPTSYTVGTSSWYDIAANSTEDNPVLVQVYKVPNVVLYKITLQNSPHFHVRVTGQGSTTATKVTNLTVWGLKLLAPWTAHNTDGVDPSNATNVTLTNSVISDGDDESAIASSGSSGPITANHTYSNLLLTSGHGLSIGSITYGGVSNIQYNNVNFNGPVTTSGSIADSNSIALRIKSYAGNGGAVNNVTYNGVCAQNVYTNIDLDPFYSSSSATTLLPQYGTTSAPITYQNIYFGTSGKINLQGYNASTYLSNVVLNNVYQNTSTLNLKAVQSADPYPSPENDAITLNGTYYPAAWGTLASSTNNVTETLNATAAASYPTAYCANAYPTLVGELYATTTASGTTTNNINKAVTLTLPASVTLNAMLEPVTTPQGYGADTSAAAPTASVQFLDGSIVVGTGTLGANGTLTSVTLTNPAAGTHTYTANYVGDSTYAAYPFGASTYTGTQNGAVPAATPLIITVNPGPASQLAFSAAPASSIVYGNGPGTVQVIADDVAGDQLTTLSGVVTLTVAGPNGYSATYTATASNGTATFSSLANPPGVGSYTYTATQGSLTSSAAGETVTPATATIAGTASTRNFDAADASFSYVVTGLVNGDTASVLSGAPAFTPSDVRTSPAGATYPVVLSQGTLAAANYVFSFSNGAVTVQGGVPQNILFAPLPNLAVGGSYQLSARATSGLPVTYSTTSSNVTISGTTLTVNSAGAVTVNANSAANTNYAAATQVSQSFTAH